MKAYCLLVKNDKLGMDVIDMTDQTFQRTETKMANHTKTNNETDTKETLEITCTKGGLRPTRQPKHHSFPRIPQRNKPENPKRPNPDEKGQ